jgi:single-strand DNA-binding protein
MADTLTTAGLVATTPRHLVTAEGLQITSFRLACSNRRFDQASMKWVDGDTNWYTITAFKTLAINTASSISKGDRIIVSGNLRVRDWDNGETTGTSIEVEANFIGHDLNWGTSNFTRTVLLREKENEPEPEIV